MEHLCALHSVQDTGRLCCCKLLDSCSGQGWEECFAQAGGRCVGREIGGVGQEVWWAAVARNRRWKSVKSDSGRLDRTLQPIGSSGEEGWLKGTGLYSPPLARTPYLSHITPRSKCLPVDLLGQSAVITGTGRTTDYGRPVGPCNMPSCPPPASRPS
jgi:hypothetical protein